MAKDILVNTQSGDFIISEKNAQTIFYDVVWGKLFDADEGEYMNIIVPFDRINQIKWTDNKFTCNIKTSYTPSSQNFLARLVVKNADGYKEATSYHSNAPSAMSCAYYPTFTSKPQPLTPAMLPIINTEGYFKVVFERYFNKYGRALIYSITDYDFSIGESDNQSAQLLTKCAPSKSYRYPTTGLDITKYINSVVDNTDLITALQSEFKSDSKDITSAEFDNSTGDLSVEFTGTEEADDNNLADPSTLSLDVFRLSSDDYIKELIKISEASSVNNEEYIESLNAITNFAGIYLVCNANNDYNVDIEPIEYTKVNESHMKIDFDGSLITTTNNVLVLQATLIPNRIYLSKRSFISYFKDEGIYKLYPRFRLLNDSGDVVYVDELDFAQDAMSALGKVFHGYIDCFIPLKPLIIQYVSDMTNFSKVLQNNTYLLADTTDNYKYIMVISENKTTGKMAAYLTNNSAIQDVFIDNSNNQITVMR